MNWCLVAIVIVAAEAAKLDRTYLPPASAKTADGSSADLKTPYQTPKVKELVENNGNTDHEEIQNVRSNENKRPGGIPNERTSGNLGNGGISNERINENQGFGGIPSARSNDNAGSFESSRFGVTPRAKDQGLGGIPNERISGNLRNGGIPSPRSYGNQDQGRIPSARSNENHGFGGISNVRRNGNQGLGGIPSGGFTNEFQGVVVDAATAGTRGAGDTGLGGPRASYGFEASKVGANAFSTPELEEDKQIPPQHQPNRPTAESDRNANVISYDSDVMPDYYRYNFETDNGIMAQENALANNGVQAQGSFSYTGDDGKVYSIMYTADENGFRPSGSHLPTPPPIPEAILRSLERNAKDEANGVIDDGTYDARKYNGGDYKESDNANGDKSKQSQVYENQAAPRYFTTSGSFVKKNNVKTFGFNEQESFGSRSQRIQYNQNSAPVNFKAPQDSEYPSSSTSDVESVDEETVTNTNNFERGSALQSYTHETPQSDNKPKIMSQIRQGNTGQTRYTSAPTVSPALSSESNLKGTDQPFSYPFHQMTQAAAYSYSSAYSGNRFPAVPETNPQMVLSSHKGQFQHPLKSHVYSTTETSDISDETTTITFKRDMYDSELYEYNKPEQSLPAPDQNESPNQSNSRKADYQADDRIDIEIMDHSNSNKFNYNVDSFGLKMTGSPLTYHGSSVEKENLRSDSERNQYSFRSNTQTSQAPNTFGSDAQSSPTTSQSFGSADTRGPSQQYFVSDHTNYENSLITDQSQESDSISSQRLDSSTVQYTPQPFRSSPRALNKQSLDKSVGFEIPPKPPLSPQSTLFDAQASHFVGAAEMFGGPRTPPSYDESGYHY